MNAPVTTPDPVSEPPNANALEAAAQTVERAALSFNTKAIADLLVQYIGNEGTSHIAATAVVEGISPLFDMVADRIRKIEIEESEKALTDRDKKVINLTLDRVQEAAYRVVRNPAKKPRVSGETVRKGIWWSKLVDIIQAHRVNAQSLKDHEANKFNQGWNQAIKKAADALRTVHPMIDPGDGTGRRLRKPTEYAEVVEKLSK